MLINNPMNNVGHKPLGGTSSQTFYIFIWSKTNLEILSSQNLYCGFQFQEKAEFV